MTRAQGRLWELWHHLTPRRASKKRTEIALESARQLAEEGQFPQAHDAFDNGLFTLDLARFLESVGKHWGSEVACSRPMQWYGQWQRVDMVAAALRQEHPESFRPVTGQCRKGERKHSRVLTKGVRLKRYGRKRLVMVHATAALSDAPRFLRTDAQHWESGRVLETWSSRWAAEIFPEFGKQVTGLASAQVRQEEAVTRHCRLSCVAQSLLQRAPASPSASERCAFAQGGITIGQKARAIAREALEGLWRFAASLLARGHKGEQILEMLMPAWSP
jgi:hypothetical protein